MSDAGVQFLRDEKLMILPADEGIHTIQKTVAIGADLRPISGVAAKIVGPDGTYLDPATLCQIPPTRIEERVLPYGLHVS